MSVKAFKRRQDELLGVIHEEFKAGIDRFRTARKVLIPKQGSDRMGKLGITGEIDRMVSQSTNLVF